MKTLIIKLVTHGVYGRSDEMPSFKDHTLVNEFLVQWIFLKGVVGEMPFERRMMIWDSMMRGPSATVLRKLVKKFGLSKFNYPINTGTSKPVLLIWDHPDLTATEATEKKE